ncbi:hypothetical protein LJR202_000282 [Brevundimonas sp. LjRoot202]
MSTFDYSRPLATANRLIEKFGQLGAIRREGAPTGPAYDPTPGAPVDHPARFAVMSYGSNEIDGSRILTTDKKVLLAPGSLAVEPTTSDLLVEADGSTLTIIDVDPLKPAETTLLWTVQARR